MPGHPETELSPAGQMLFRDIAELRTEFKSLAKELRDVTNALIAIKTQDVASELTKFKEKEEKKFTEVDARLDALEKSKLQMVTIGFFIWGLLGFGVTLFELYNKIKGR